MDLTDNIKSTSPPPIMEAIGWTKGLSLPKDRPLLNLSQAAPVGAPPLEMREHLARLVVDDVSVHLYGPDLGLPDLRAQVASDWSKDYGGQITAERVAITSGCNQAFCASIASIASAGDAVLLPSPYYFNHFMHLTTMGIEPRLLECNQDMVPDVKKAASLIDARVRAIVLVTPNNPTGEEYPKGVIHAFYELAKTNGIPLILDETYRDFSQSESRPHDLFEDPDWPETLIHLYSFSKAFRLTGHRVGAMIASSHLLVGVEKYIDAVTICPNQLGQRAALFGLQNLKDWVAGERQKILSRKAKTLEVVSGLSGVTLRSCGAYFAFLEHSFEMTSDLLAERLVKEQSLLVLPATMFAPRTETGGNGTAESCLRLAFANTDHAGLDEFARRWRNFSP